MVKVTNEFTIETSLDKECVEEVLEYIEESTLTKEQALTGLKMRENGKGKGGRPSKVKKWAKKIEDNAATLEEARDHMSDPTWYRLKSRVEE